MALRCRAHINPLVYMYSMCLHAAANLALVISQNILKVNVCDCCTPYRAAFWSCDNDPVCWGSYDEGVEFECVFLTFLSFISLLQLINIYCMQYKMIYTMTLLYMVSFVYLDFYYRN